MGQCYYVEPQECPECGILISCIVDGHCWMCVWDYKFLNGLDW